MKYFAGFFAREIGHLGPRKRLRLLNRYHLKQDKMGVAFVQPGEAILHAVEESIGSKLAWGAAFGANSRVGYLRSGVSLGQPSDRDSIESLRRFMRQHLFLTADGRANSSSAGPALTKSAMCIPARREVKDLLTQMGN